MNYGQAVRFSDRVTSPRWPFARRHCFLRAVLLCFWPVLFGLLGCSTAPPLTHTPFYPIGIYGVDSTNHFQIVKEAGFNLITGPADVRFLNAAQAAGLQVFASPRTSAGTNFNAKIAHQAVREVDSHPALWAWYLIDEPDLNAVSPDQVRAANRCLKSAHAKTPTAVVLFQGYEAIHYANIADITLVDRYPVAWMPLCNFAQHVRMARLALGRDKPLIPIIQAFDWNQWKSLLPRETNLREPTYDELRNMTYSALAERANGLFYFVFDSDTWHIVEHPRLWNDLKRVVAEVNRRSPLFQAEHIWWPYLHSYANPEARFNESLQSAITPALLRVKSGKREIPAGDYLLAVNTTTNYIDYGISLLAHQPADIPVVGENRQVTAREGWRIQDIFGPYAVHVYGPMRGGDGR